MFILSQKHDELVPKGSTDQCTKFVLYHSVGSKIQLRRADTGVTHFTAAENWKIKCTQAFWWKGSWDLTTRDIPMCGLTNLTVECYLSASSERPCSHQKNNGGHVSRRSSSRINLYDSGAWAKQESHDCDFHVKRDQSKHSALTRLSFCKFGYNPSHYAK